MPRNAIDAFNRMHACYMVRVEWDIGGLKRKFARLVKQFDVTKPKHTNLFRSCALLTNFPHRRLMDLSQEVARDRVKNLGAPRWEGNFLEN